MNTGLQILLQSRQAFRELGRVKASIQQHEYIARRGKIARDRDRDLEAVGLRLNNKGLLVDIIKIKPKQILTTPKAVRMNRQAVGVARRSKYEILLAGGYVPSVDQYPPARRADLKEQFVKEFEEASVRTGDIMMFMMAGQNKQGESENG